VFSLMAVVSAAIPATGTAIASTMPDPLRDRPILILAVLEVCLSIAYLALWRAAPDFRVFRGMGAFFALVAVSHSATYFFAVDQDIVTAFTSPILVDTAGEAMEVKNRRWIWLLTPVYAVSLIAIFWPPLHLARSWALDASEIPMAWLIVKGFRNKSPRIRLVSAGFAIFTLVRCTLSNEFQNLTSIPQFFEIAGWRTYWTSPTLVLIGVLTLAVYFRDLLQDRKEKQRLASELEAARTVQQVLIPCEIPNVPGLRIESVYKPAGEVGGDFFQIIPTAAGGVLAIIGDVSGKGMPAAMTVSLLVGTVRTLAHYTQSPGEILAAMNQRMLARSHGGFTTCLVMRADPSGTLKAANAGHLAPYCNGEELTLEGGVPLGLDADASYPESTFTLAANAQLTLLTDGVVEARAQDGELYGFERTSAVSTQSAGQIARAAQAFGQEDDITVLTLTLLPVEVADA
jgi:hypothetical protein